MEEYNLLFPNDETLARFKNEWRNLKRNSFTWKCRQINLFSAEKADKNKKYDWKIAILNQNIVSIEYLSDIFEKFEGKSIVYSKEPVLLKVDYLVNGDSIVDAVVFSLRLTFDFKLEASKIDIENEIFLDLVERCDNEWPEVLSFILQNKEELQLTTIQLCRDLLDNCHQYTYYPILYHGVKPTFTRYSMTYKFLQSCFDIYDNKTKKNKSGGLVGYNLGGLASDKWHDLHDSEIKELTKYTTDFIVSIYMKAKYRGYIGVNVEEKEKVLETVMNEVENVTIMIRDDTDLTLVKNIFLSSKYPIIIMIDRCLVLD